MATYTVAVSGTASSGTDPTVNAAFEYAGGEPGCAVLQAYLGDVEAAAFVHRQWVAISTGTTGVVNQTPEKLLVNSRASDATGVNSANTVTRGRTATVAGYNNTTALFGVPRAWHPPDPRQPFVCDASERVGQVVQSNNFPRAVFTIVAEPNECPTRPLRRRGTVRGAGMYPSFASGKRGATASPTVRHLANGGGFRMLELDDWRVVVRARPAALLDAGGGTTYPLDVAGTLTTAGALIKQVNRSYLGTLTTAGSLARATSRLFGGTLTTAGALLRQASRAFAGTLTTAGNLVRQTNQGLTGMLTSSGVLGRMTSRALGGTLGLAGALRQLIARAFAGTLSTAGSLSNLGVKNLLVGGVLTTAGALVNVLQAGAGVLRQGWSMLRHWPPRR